jgi:hypothetical protein
MRDGLPVDVAHAHRGLGFVGDELGDAAAHDARTEDAGVADLNRRCGDALFLRLIHHEEEADEVLGDVAGRAGNQRYDFLDLARESALDAVSHTVLHDVDRFQRRRVVAVGLLEHGFARFAEDDAPRQRIPLDIKLCPIASSALRFARELFGDLQEDRRRHDFVDQSDALGALPVEHLPLKDDVERGGKADEPRQLGHAAPCREDAELRLRQSDLRLGAVGHDAIVAADGQLATSAERGAVDGGHGDLRQFRETVNGLLSEAGVFGGLVCR